MTAYLAWWIAGGAIGLVAAARMLQRRDALTGAAVAALLASSFGCLYGAKVQFRLRYEPFWDAIVVPAGDLLSPGYHIPLGLVCGFGVAMVVARVLRGAPLLVADALALAGAVMMPIGRIGCMIAGCCTGTVCPWWWRVGLTYGPGTGAYAEQVSAGLIPADAAVSLPVHALPVYFAMLGTATAAIQLHLLRRNARPGAVAVVGFLLYPLGQLAIEQLRTPSDDRGPVMTVVLIGMIAGTVVALSAVWSYDRWRSARSGVRHVPFWARDQQPSVNDVRPA